MSRNSCKGCEYSQKCELVKMTKEERKRRKEWKEMETYIYYDEKTGKTIYTNGLTETEWIPTSSDILENDWEIYEEEYKKSSLKAALICYNRKKNKRGGRL